MTTFIKKAFCFVLCAALLCVPVAVSAEKEIIDYGDNYVYYGEAIVEGEGEYELSADFTYTVFDFVPTSASKFTISCPQGLVGIVSYNGMWVTHLPSADTVAASSITWTCTSVGQSIMVAFTAESSPVTITVESEASDVTTIERITYENKTTPTPFTFEGDKNELLYVNTLNKTVDTAVLGDDGYYHLNSADGYILYANLNDAQMSLYAAADVGQLKSAVYDENGKATAIVDYNLAFAEYAECMDSSTSLYPLTDDLIEIFSKVGNHLGWYGSEGWIGGNYDDAWMFACCYLEEEPVTIVAGDINLDGVANSIDSNYLSRYLVGLYAIAAGSDEATAADINGDGSINAVDGNLLKRIIAGVIQY